MSSRVILVTGANGGLGVAIARAFLAESPASVIYLGVHTRRDRVEGLAAEFGERARCIALDVVDPGAWEAAVATILAGEGHIDVLVNNAGVHEDGLLAQLSWESWKRVLSTNLDAVFHGCRAVLPGMISRHEGRIVNVASLSALLAPAGQTHYAAAKAGVVALTQALAKEVARIGITVNAVCPGYIDTDALMALGPEGQQAARNRVPMRRFGRPDEVAATVRFLASLEASYVTGSVVKVDGGIL